MWKELAEPHSLFLLSLLWADQIIAVITEGRSPKRYNKQSHGITTPEPSTRLYRSSSMQPVCAAELPLSF